MGASLPQEDGSTCSSAPSTALGESRDARGVSLELFSGLRVSQEALLIFFFIFKAKTKPHDRRGLVFVLREPLRLSNLRRVCVMGWNLHRSVHASFLPVLPV